MFRIYAVPLPPAFRFNLSSSPVFSFCFVEPLSSVSSLEVHFDLLDLTELTDMSDQELAEVFADSDEENHNESPAGKACYKYKSICFHNNNKNKGKENIFYCKITRFTQGLCPKTVQ